MVIPENKGSKYYERLSVMYCIVYFFSSSIFCTVLLLLMVIPENKDCKYYERLSVIYCIVYFSSHLLIVNGDS